LIDLGVRVQVMIPHHLGPFCRYEIAEVPALKIFRKGFVFSYEGPGDTQGIVDYLLELKKKGRGLFRRPCHYPD